jgi:hypothetical protein
MSSSLNRGGDVPSGMQFTCHICGEALNELAGGHLTFCPAHFAEYQARQQHGVTADELEARWHDTLATWQDRPAAIQQEGDAASLHFQERREGWLLFQRGYARRAPDWLTIQQQSGVVQRFVEVEDFEVSDALLGYKSAPQQEQLEQRWGQPQSYRHLPEDLLDRVGRWDLERVARELPMILYGVAGQPFGLHLTQRDGEAEGDQLTQVALTFTGWSVDRSYYARLKLGSWSRSYLRQWEQRWELYGPPGPELLSRPFTLSTQHVAKQTLVIAGQEQQVTFYQLPSAPDPSTLQAARERLLREGFGQLTLREFKNLAEQLGRYEHPEVLRFQRPGVPEYQFTWQEAGETFVLGESANLTLSELTHLLEQLVRVNDRPDLLLQYQAELDSDFHRRSQHEEAGEQVKRRFERAIEEAEMPLYGVADRPLGLQFSGTHSKKGADGERGITLVFRSEGPAQPERMFAISNYNRAAFQQGEVVLPHPATANLEFVTREVPIGGRALRGTIAYRASDTRGWFRLQDEQTFLSGQARGVSLEELVQLLKQLVPLNKRPDLIKQYQTELDRKSRAE